MSLPQSPFFICGLQVAFEQGFHYHTSVALLLDAMRGTPWFSGTSYPPSGGSLPPVAGSPCFLWIRSPSDFPVSLCARYVSSPLLAIFCAHRFGLLSAFGPRAVFRTYLMTGPSIPLPAPRRQLASQPLHFIFQLKIYIWSFLILSHPTLPTCREVVA